MKIKRVCTTAVILMIIFNRLIFSATNLGKNDIQMQQYLQQCGIQQNKLDKSLDNCNQIILVKYNVKSKFNCVIQLFDKKQNNWTTNFQNINGIVGRNGISENKKEGDGKSPKGIFSLGLAFGMYQKPKMVNMPYKQTTKYDYWIDDVSSSQYNQWVGFYGNPYSKWKSFEKLYIKPYRYAVAINYNVNPIVKGKGSAIFLHIRDSFAVGSSGCVGVKEVDMMKILKWLNAAKHPLIIIC
jgi:L,D-peptidoglycan transpeptidase YkuD (ErfK/YbiS/YcfS/YnhG family)